MCTYIYIHVCIFIFTYVYFCGYRYSDTTHFYWRMRHMIAPALNIYIFMDVQLHSFFLKMRHVTAPAINQYIYIGGWGG